MTQEQYYTPPPQHIFDEIKENAIKIWQTFDDQYGYATDKISRIKDIQNVSDNAWYMVAMFDAGNKARLIAMSTEETARMIIDAMTMPDDR